MKTHALIFALFVAPLLTSTIVVTPAHAASCADIANEAAEKANAEVLAVTSSAKGCKVKLKMPAKNGKQSRIVTRVIKN